MSRQPVHIREATLDDAGALVEIWAAAAPRCGDRDADPEPVVEAARGVARVAADPDQRLLVAVLDGRVVGAVHLIRAPLSPIHAEHAVHVSHLNVLDGFRRHGAGRALVEAAVSWAEEKNTAHVLAAALSSSRDANRFMTRLGLAQVAVLRGASVSALRARLPVQTPAAALVGGRGTHRTVGQVLTQRRSQRRSRTPAS